METQLILFEETSEERVTRELENLKAQADKIRKSLFAKYTELMQLYLEQREEIESLKLTISNNK